MKKENSVILSLVEEGLTRSSKEETLKTLGDRSAYIGSSDIHGCPFKTVSSKLFGETHDLNTLIRFRRGHMSESIISDAYDRIEEKFPGYSVEYQKQVSHPDYQWMQAHIDFLIYNDTEAKIIECKSCNGIPKVAKSEWLTQINWQLGLSLLGIFKGKQINLTASIIAFDLNTGEIAEFGDFEPDEAQFTKSMEKAERIMAAICASNPMLVECQPSGLCKSYCSFKGSCPYFGNEKDTKTISSVEAISAVERYYSAKTFESSLNKTVKAAKSDIFELFGNNDGIYNINNEYELQVKVVRKSNTTLNEKRLMEKLDELGVTIDLKAFYDRTDTEFTVVNAVRL